MTVLYDSPVFGPIHSRRLGVSLGINLLPADGKCCSFDCIYCECGFNKDFRPRQKFPTRQAVGDALRARLVEMKEHGLVPNVLTFAGNGEPTMHPEFPDIVADVIRLRDEFFPEAKVSVLTNATEIVKKEVFDALLLVDNNIVKLDTVAPEYIERVDRPVAASYDLPAIVEAMKRFGPKCTVQTMFLQGEFEGRSVSNVSDEYVGPWLETVCQICPKEVMIYTIDRETPAHELRKATREQLDAIASRVRESGLTCQVSY